WRTTRILLRHARDEVTNLRADLWSTTVPPPGKPTPIEPKSGTMPPDNRLRLHDHQYLGPLGPQSPKRQEEQSIPLTQVWSRVLALEHAYLVAQRGKLKPEIMARPEERSEPTEETHDEREHGSSLHDSVAMIR